MKKKWILLICAPLLILLTAAVIFFSMGCSVTVGRYLEADNGQCLLILDNSPMIITGVNSSTRPFQGLTDGDQILLVHGVMEESYPVRTRGYLCIRLSEGTREDIPQTVIERLGTLGFLNFPSAHAQYSFGDVSLSLQLPAGWEYAIVPYGPKSRNCGLTFWCSDTPEMKQYLLYYPDGLGFCGTGLHAETVTVGEYETRKYYYTSADSSFILSFPFDRTGDVAYQYYGNADWWAQYSDAVMQILRTVNYQ